MRHEATLRDLVADVRRVLARLERMAARDSRTLDQMVLDTLANAQRYTALHPAFARAFAYLSSVDLDALSAGRNEIDGDRMFVILDRKDGRGRGGARLEAHRRYIDIQYTIAGEEEIGWTPLASCAAPEGAFDETNTCSLGATPGSSSSSPAGTLTVSR